MKTILKKVGKVRFLGPAVIIAIALVLISNVVYAYSTSNLAIIPVWEDRFYNYDFDGTAYPPNQETDVTCPVTMLFYYNASGSKVKNNIYWGTAGSFPQPPASTDYGLLNDGDGWFFDGARGTKHIIWSWELLSIVYVHLRVYPHQSYMQNYSYGKYVIGTTHFDAFPFEEWFGFNEYAENYLADYASGKGYSVYEDCVYYRNYEDRLELIIHPIYFLPAIYTWQSDGWATVVYVP